MSSLHCKFPPNHRVFQGGRYLRAFDHLADIDHFEHSILTFLGSLMPFDKGFVDLPAFPSIATISRSTKISESTVRTRVRGLEKKGYLKIKTVRFINQQGKFQQGSNDYFLSNLAFETLEDVLESREYISSIRQRAVGDNSPEQFCPSALASPSPSSGGGDSPLVHTRAPLELVPKSSLNSQTESLRVPDSSSHSAIFTRRAEVDRIVAAWEEVVGLSVSKGERDRFQAEYLRSRAGEIHFMERIAVLVSDAYLLSRAKSVNFLFKGFDFAVKNRNEIKQAAGKALTDARSAGDLEAIVKQLPGLLAAKSRNFAEPSDAVVCQLFQTSVGVARKRLDLPLERPLPKNEGELIAEIQRAMKSEIPEQSKERLGTILQMIRSCNFSMCLNLYAKYQKVEEVTQ